MIAPGFFLRRYAAPGDWTFLRSGAGVRDEILSGDGVIDQLA